MYPAVAVQTSLIPCMLRAFEAFELLNMLQLVSVILWALMPTPEVASDNKQSPVFLFSMAAAVAEILKGFESQ